MQVLISEILRYSAEFMLPMSKIIKPILTEYGGSKWRKALKDVDDLVEKVKEKMEPKVGHGISREKADELYEAMRSQRRIDKALQTMANYMMAGMKPTPQGKSHKVIKLAASRLTITMNLENEAFKDQNAEIARILRELSKDFQFNRKPTVVKDINGNNVGKVTMKS